MSSTSTTPKVSLYSPSELKTTLDDHLPVYLNSSTTPSNAPLPKPLRFTVSHKYTYVRLGLGYGAVAIALYIFYLDYVLKQEFRDTKTVTLYAVTVYPVLNALLTLWIWLGEKGNVFSGSRTEQSSSGRPRKTGKASDGDVTTLLEICSHAPSKKFNPVYRITATWSVTASDGTIDATRSGNVDVSAPFTRFFASDGFLVPQEFETWLRREIPIVSGGAAQGKVAQIDPQRADLLSEKTSRSTEGNMSVQGGSNVLQSQRGDTVITFSGKESGDAVAPSPAKKRGRPRKE